jgi:hypothetical protein
MFTPVLELEGTWEEIVAQVPDYQNTPLQVTIQVKEPFALPEQNGNEQTGTRWKGRLTPEEQERHLKILKEVSEAINSKLDPKPDNRDWLREAREGAMIRESLLK